VHFLGAVLAVRRAGTGLVGWEGDGKEDKGRIGETERRQLETRSPAFYRPRRSASVWWYSEFFYPLDWRTVHSEV
jgi:hypothetical protein